LVASEHVGVEVDAARPLERAELTIHSEGPEDLGVVADLRDRARGNGGGAWSAKYIRITMP
jgi:hypothetical protein